MPWLVLMILILLAGFGLGAVFFGGLWLTVRALPKSRYPAVLMLGSFWVRTAVVAAGFILAVGGRWQNAIACLLGFLTARVLLARRIRERNGMTRSAG